MKASYVPHITKFNRILYYKSITIDYMYILTASMPCLNTKYIHLILSISILSYTVTYETIAFTLGLVLNINARHLQNIEHFSTNTKIGNELSSNSTTVPYMYIVEEHQSNLQEACKSLL